MLAYIGEQDRLALGVIAWQARLANVLAPQRCAHVRSIRPPAMVSQTSIASLLMHRLSVSATP